MIGKFSAMLVVAALALAALGAGDAFAATEAVTEEASWLNAAKARYAEGVGQAITCSNAGANIENTAGEKSVNFQITTKVLATPVWLTATGIECVEMTITDVTAGTHMAVAAGKLKFTGVTVMEPAGCGINANLTTNALSGDLKMDKANATVSLLELKPTVGEVVVPFELTGALCPLAGVNSQIKGTFFALMTDATGVPGAQQRFAFAKPEAEMGTLHVGPEKADVFGELLAERGGESWEAEKK
jgi:hypothetical protein